MSKLVLSALKLALKLPLGLKRRGFERALASPAETQTRVLGEICTAMSQTEYGREKGIHAGMSYEEFARAVPVVRYDDLQPWIEKQKAQESRVIAPERVRFYEKTSGSSGAAKYIPYTRGLSRSFEKMFALWLGDLLQRGPSFRTGKVFVSISPAFQTETTTAAGVRVGLEDDSEYLSPFMRLVLGPYLVIPHDIKKLHEPRAYKHALSLHLLRERGLETISVWNPSFMELLLEYIDQNREDLAREVGNELIAKLLRSDSKNWRAYWPELKLISCWGAAQSRSAFESLQAQFPDIYFQEKGLLATEAPMTLPWIEAKAQLPLLDEVFFEFELAGERIVRLHELNEGDEGVLILSQRGGLVRYRIGDRVRAGASFRGGARALEFLGREGGVSDLVGEKLNEAFVATKLAQLQPEAGAFWILLPVAGEKPGYELVVSSGSADLGERLDALLCEAYHYGVARKLGQLSSVRVRVVARAKDIYFETYTAKGMKLGDIKHRALVTSPEDAKRLRQAYEGA